MNNIFCGGMNMKILLPVLLLLPGLLWSPVAMSQQYAGIALGFSSIDEEANGAEVDDEAFAGMLYAGAQLSPYAALELAYLRSAALDYDQRTGNISLNADLDFQAWIPSIVLRWGADRASLFSSVGVAFWEADIDLGLIDIGDDQSDLALSIGFDLQPMGAWNIRGQWIFVAADSSDVFVDTNVHTFLLGAHYRF